MISASNINFGYDNNLIIKDFTFNIPEIGLVAFTGQSGCGKTTLLKLLLNQLCPLSGTIETNLSRKNIVYIDQFATLDNNLSIELQYKLFCKIYNTEIDYENFFSKLEILELDYIQTKTLIKELSVGERKRLYLALAMCINFDLLIVDEPTSSLDYDLKDRVFKVLKSISKNKSVLITIHDNEYYDLIDLIYEIKDYQIKIIKNIIKYDCNQNVKNDNHFTNLFKISSIKSKLDFRNFILVILVLLAVTSFISFQQVKSIFYYKNTNELTESIGKNIIYTTFESIPSNLLPSDWRYNYFYESLAITDKNSVNRIKDLDQVVDVKPYYQFNTTNYYSRYSDIDTTKSFVKLYDQNNNLIKNIFLDGTESSTPAIVTYYEEENIKIDNLTIKGNYIDEEVAKMFGLENYDFNSPITMTLEVGLPICILERNDRLIYYENNNAQDIEYDVILNEVLYDKKEIKINIDGILKKDEYMNLYDSDCQGLIYVNYKNIDDIINENTTTNIRNSLKLYDDLNEKVESYIPSHYAIIVESVDNIIGVTDQIETIDNRILSYSPNIDVNELVNLRSDNLMNNIILNCFYFIMGSYIIYLVLYNYNLSNKNKIISLINFGMTKKEIRRILFFDINIASLIIFIASFIISYIRIFFEGELLLNNRIEITLFIILFNIVFVTIIHVINNVVLRRELR